MSTRLVIKHADADEENYADDADDVYDVDVNQHCSTTRLMRWNGAKEFIQFYNQINNSASVQPVDQMLTDSYLHVSLKPNCFPLTSVCFAGQLFPCLPVITPLQPKPLPATLGMQTVRNRRICPVAQIAGQFVCSLN